MRIEKRKKTRLKSSSVPVAVLVTFANVKITMKKTISIKNRGHHTESSSNIKRVHIHYI